MQSPLDSEDLKERVLAAAGIGNPGRFFALLRGAGLAFAELPLPDHYDFRDNPFAQVDADVILITEKDAVKLAHDADERCFALQVRAALEPALIDWLVERLRGQPIA